MKFNQITDGWFDGVADWASAHPTSKQPLLVAASKRPTRKNVLKFRELVRGETKAVETKASSVPSPDIWFGGLVMLDVHIVEVLNKEFRKEFRFAFGEVTASESFRTGYRKVSAASELFSMARQALTYHD